MAENDASSFFWPLVYNILELTREQLVQTYEYAAMAVLCEYSPVCISMDALLGDEDYEATSGKHILVFDNVHQLFTGCLSLLQGMETQTERAVMLRKCIDIINQQLVMDSLNEMKI